MALWHCWWPLYPHIYILFNSVHALPMGCVPPCGWLGYGYFSFIPYSSGGLGITETIRARPKESHSGTLTKTGIGAQQLEPTITINKITERSCPTFGNFRSTFSSMKTILTTARLRLRELNFSDTPFLVELLNSPGFIENIGDRGVRNEKDAEKYLTEGPLASYSAHGIGLWCVELLATQEPLGMCGLLQRDHLEHPDIGFAFLPQHQGKKYGFESAEATLRYGFETHSFPRILAVTSPTNLASQGLLRKIGLAEEGIQPWPNGEDSLFFGLNNPNSQTS